MDILLVFNEKNNLFDFGLQRYAFFPDI